MVDHGMEKNQYEAQVNQVMVDAGLGSNFWAEVIDCLNIAQVFEALGKKGVEHVAVLTNSSEPINDSLKYIKETLAENKSVPIALFYPKEPMASGYFN